MYLTGTCRGVGYRWKEGVGLLGLVLGPGGACGGVRRAFGVCLGAWVQCPVSKCVRECMGVCVYLRVFACVVVYVAPTRRC